MFVDRLSGFTRLIGRTGFVRTPFPLGNGVYAAISIAALWLWLAPA
jgi:hypothetical protein